MPDSPVNLPFQDLLEELGQERIRIGVREHLALGRLLERYDGCSRSQFRHAVAALLATNRDEVRRIEIAFDRLYPVSKPQRRVDPPRRRPRKWIPSVVVGVVAMIAIVVILWREREPATVRRNNPTPADGSGSGGAGSGGAGSSSTGTGSDGSGGSAPGSPDTACAPLPRLTTTVTAWNPEALELAGVLAFALLTLDALRRGRRRLRARTQEHSRSRLAAIAGPRDYKLELTSLLRRNERSSYAQLATALARAASDPVTTDELDVNRTLRDSLREFPRLRLAHRLRRRPSPVVVLEDISNEMKPWRAKAAAMLTALRRQGLAIVRVYFQRDLSQVSKDHRGRCVDLSVFRQQYGESPLVIVSCNAPIDFRPVIGWQKRVWLNPIGDASLWPDALGSPDLPIAVLPMTQRGLLDVSRALRDPGARSAPRDLDADPSRRDARLFAALFSLAPAPTYELAELMRARLFPHAPEELILVAEPQLSSGAGNTGAMMALRASLAKLDPGRAHERRTRELLLAVFDASEPSRDTAAHLRWQRDRALQQVALGDPTGARTLEQLATSPLAEELSLHLDREAEIENHTARAGELGFRRLAREVMPDRRRGLSFTWPHIAACLLCAGVLAVGALLGISDATWVMPRKQEPGLTLSSDTPGFLTLSTTLSPPVASATLYRNGETFEADVPLGVSRSVPGDALPGCFQLGISRNEVQLVSKPLQLAAIEPRAPRFFCYSPPLTFKDISANCYRTADECERARSATTGVSPCKAEPIAFCARFVTGEAERCFSNLVHCNQYQDEISKNGARVVVCLADQLNVLDGGTVAPAATTAGNGSGAAQAAEHATRAGEFTSKYASIDSAIKSLQCNKASQALAAARTRLDDLRTAQTEPDDWIRSQRSLLAQRANRLTRCWTDSGNAAFATALRSHGAELDACLEDTALPLGSRMHLIANLLANGNVEMLSAAFLDTAGRTLEDLGPGPTSCMRAMMGVTGVLKLSIRPPTTVQIEATIDVSPRGVGGGSNAGSGSATDGIKGLGTRCNGPRSCPKDATCVMTAYDGRMYCRPFCTDASACTNTGIVSATQCREPVRRDTKSSGLRACMRPDDVPELEYFACRSDDNCDTGAMCIDNADGRRYCKPLCNGDDDCVSDASARAWGATYCKRVVTNANPDAAGKRFCLAKTDAGVFEPAVPATGASATESGALSLDAAIVSPASTTDAGVIGPASQTTHAKVPPVVGRIFASRIQGSEIFVTIDVGINAGVAKNWTLHVLRGNSDTPLAGGEIEVVRVDKTVTVGKTKLTSDQLLSNPRVRLSAP